jgi:hypothetical protein
MVDEFLVDLPVNPTPQRLLHAMLRESSESIRLFGLDLPKDCDCDDHEGAHFIHVSRCQMIENYRMMSEYFDRFDWNSQAQLLANLILDIMRYETERKLQLLMEFNLARSKNNLGGI